MCVLQHLCCIIHEIAFSCNTYSLALSSQWLAVWSLLYVHSNPCPSHQSAYKGHRSPFLTYQSDSNLGSPAGFVILECFSYLIPPPTCCRGQSMDNYETLQWSESHKLRENPISWQQNIKFGLLATFDTSDAVKNDARTELIFTSFWARKSTSPLVARVVKSLEFQIYREDFVVVIVCYLSEWSRFPWFFLCTQLLQIWILSFWIS